MTKVLVRRGAGFNNYNMVASIIFGRVTHKNETADHVPYWVHILPWVPGAPLAHQIAPSANSPQIKATRIFPSHSHFYGMYRNTHTENRILAGISQNLKFHELFISAYLNR